MARLARDIPSSLLLILKSVDYSKITDMDYDRWLSVINRYACNYVSSRKGAVELVFVDVPLRQDFCDIINGYDFKSVGVLKLAMFMPLIKNWANQNLPLLKKII